MEIYAFLLECPNPSLHDPVALRLPDIGRSGPDPQPPQLAQELMCTVLRAPIVTETQSQCHLLHVTVVVSADTLAYRLERRPPVTPLGHVPSNDVLAAVVNRSKKPAPAVLTRVEPRRIRSPQLVRSIRPNPPLVAPIPMVRQSAHRHQQLMLPHKP